MLPRSFATACLTALLAFASQVAAQSLPWPGESARQLDSAAALALIEDGGVLPVLSRADGRLEALLLLDQPVSLNPLDRLLAPGRPALGVAGRVRTDGGQSLEAALKLDRGPGLALLCNERIGLVTTLASLSEHCLLAPLDADSHDALIGAARSRQLEAGWRSAGGAVDLSFGLSWLDSGPFGAPGSDPLDVAPLLANLFSPSQLLVAAPELAGARLLSRGLGVRGMFDLGSQRWLSFGGSVARNRLESAFLGAAPLRRWDSSALSLGLGQGNLYGEVTGHVADLPGSDALWGGLDVGISWRTPWQGQFTVGARNLISHGDSPFVGEDGKALDESETRVPYVRYKQDL